ncbi:MAG: oligosaccharide flippase family protein [Bacteroidales bacterium]|nr:oligosaccharide flippase family protein [Bacteroidales bacterium]
MIKKYFSDINLIIKDITNKNDFIRKSIILTLGTVVAQAIPVIFSPILTRLFLPEEFGLLAILGSITAIISVISTGKYETAVLIAKNRRDAVNIIGVSILLSFIISVIATILFFFFSDILIKLLNQPRLGNWIFLCPLLSFLISIYQCYNEWVVRENKFSNLAINKIINSSSITISNLFYGLIRIFQGGLILGELTGRFLSAISCVYSAFRIDYKIFKKISWKRMLFLSRINSSCPKYVLPGQLLNTIAGQVAILLIASFFSETEVGLYSMTGLILSVPASLISLTVRDVFRQRANEEFKIRGNCHSIYMKTFKIVLALSIVIFFILFLILPDFISFFFGSKWREAGIYARILCPTIMISFVAECFWGMFFIANKMKSVLLWQSQFLFFTIFSIVIGHIVFHDIKYTLICFSIGRSIVYLINLRMTYLFAKGDI